MDEGRELKALNNSESNYQYLRVCKTLMAVVFVYEISLWVACHFVKATTRRMEVLH
jgi:hypothetical protein